MKRSCLHGLLLVFRCSRQRQLSLVDIPRRRVSGPPARGIRRDACFLLARLLACWLNARRLSFLLFHLGRIHHGRVCGGDISCIFVRVS